MRVALVGGPDGHAERRGTVDRDGFLTPTAAASEAGSHRFVRVR